MSGAHSSPSTPLYNKSSHSTLTSTCRISTSYANANNESFLAGNRHYWSAQVVLTHLLNTVRHANMTAVTAAVDLYQLHIPTTDEVMACIHYSTDLYWRDDVITAEMRFFIDNMSTYERAAFVYTDDLYHLALHNPMLVRDVLCKLATPATTPVDNAQAIIDAADGELLTLASLLCASILDGGTLQMLAKSNPTGLGIVAATVVMATDTLNDIQPLIHGFWRTWLV